MNNLNLLNVLQFFWEYIQPENRVHKRKIEKTRTVRQQKTQLENVCKREYSVFLQHGDRWNEIGYLSTDQQELQCWKWLCRMWISVDSPDARRSSLGPRPANPIHCFRFLPALPLLFCYLLQAIRVSVTFTNVSEVDSTDANAQTMKTRAVETSVIRNSEFSYASLDLLYPCSNISGTVNAMNS